MTSPALPEWPPSDPAFRRSEVSAPIGRGDQAWARASEALLRWGVKTASGFAVDRSTPVEAGERLTITARVLRVTIVEPVQVLEVVREPDRVGFAYRTMPGHPVDGEEAFILHRTRPTDGDGDGGSEITLTVRSLTRAAPQQPWHALHPALRLAQLVAPPLPARPALTARHPAPVA